MEVRHKDNKGSYYGNTPGGVTGGNWIAFSSWKQAIKPKEEVYIIFQISRRKI